MSGINFLSDNLMDEAVISITSGGENAQFPLSNLQNSSPSLKFRSTSNSVTILIDTSVTQAADTIALVGDPTGTLGVTVATFKSSVTTDFSLSTAYSIDLSSEHNMGLDFITEETGRYWQLELTGNGSYAELGNVYIGQRTNLPQNSISVGSFKYGNNDNSTIKSNEYGQKFVDVRNRVKSLQGSIEACTKDETETLDDLWQLHGTSKPLWLVLDVDDVAMNDSKFRLSVYGYLKKLPGWSAAGGQLYNTTLEVEQAI